MIENLIIGGRGSGKTLELIKMSAERNIYIVCADRQRALNIAAMARELGYQIPFPITLMELPIHSRFIQEVFVDDVDVVLERIIGRRVSNITLRGNSDDIIDYVMSLENSEGEK